MSGASMDIGQASGQTKGLNDYDSMQRFQELSFHCAILSKRNEPFLYHVLMLRLRVKKILKKGEKQTCDPRSTLIP